MPVEYFDTDYLWSFSLGAYVVESTVCVKLTNVNTGEEWNFSSEQSDGDFYVNNDLYSDLIQLMDIMMEMYIVLR